MNKDEIDRLLSIEKKVIGSGKDLLDIYTIEQKYPFRERIEIGSEFDPDVRFLLEINQSSKVNVKMTLHFMENNNKVPLSRIDYYGNHVNPVEVLSSVPEFLKDYAGKFFSQESHLHYHVDGYRPLAWAMPLSDTDFPIKNIGVKDINANFAKAIMEYANLVNIKTRINVQTMIL